jgi:hypothetical protein
MRKTSHESGAGREGRRSAHGTVKLRDTRRLLAQSYASRETRSDRKKNLETKFGDYINPSPSFFSSSSSSFCSHNHHPPRLTTTIIQGSPPINHHHHPRTTTTIQSSYHHHHWSFHSHHLLHHHR